MSWILRFFEIESLRRTLSGSRRPIASKGKGGENSKLFFCSTTVIDAEGARSVSRLDVATPPIPHPRMTTLSLDDNSCVQGLSVEKCTKCLSPGRLWPDATVR